MALDKKRDEKQQQMLEVQQYLHRQRTEQRDRKLVLKKKMNEYEVGINKSLLDEAKMKTDLAGQLLRMSQTNRVTSCD
jgi:L-lactate utilization protein LutB